MPYKWTYVDGSSKVEQFLPPHDEWDINEVFPYLRACEWVEPKTEYRWRVTWEDRTTDDFLICPLQRSGHIAWTLRALPVVKVERIEVTT